MPKGVTIDFNANLAKFENSIQKATRDLDKFSDRAKRTGNTAQKAFAGIERSLAGIIGVGGLAVLAKRSLDTADAIGKLSEVSGFSASRIQELRFAFDESGVSMNLADASLRKFNKRLGLARQETGAASRAYKELGINLQQNTEQVFNDVVEAIAKFEDQSDRAAYTTQFFGDEAIKLELALRGGVSGLNAWANEARELGLVLSDELVEGAAEANDQLAIMKKIVDTQITRAFADLAPLIVKTGNAFVFLATNIGKGYRVLDSYINTSAENQFQLLFNRSKELEENIRIQESYIESFKGPEMVKDEMTAGLQELKKELDDVRKKMTALREENVQSIINQGRASTSTDEERPGRPRRTRRTSDRSTVLRFPKQEKVVPLKDPIDDFVDSLMRYREELDLVNPKLERLGQLFADGTIPLEVYKEGVKRLGFETESVLTDLPEKIEETNDAVEELGLTFTSAFEDAIVEGKNLSDVLAGLEQDIIRIMTRRLVTEPLGNFVSDAVGSAFGGGGFFGDLFGGLFRGPGAPVTALASGGRFSAGERLLVGERGPELAVFGQGGAVIPNNQLGGNITVNINAIPPGGNPDAYRLSARQGALEGSRLLSKARGIS